MNVTTTLHKVQATLDALHGLAIKFDSSEEGAGAHFSRVVEVLCKDAGKSLDACLIELGDVGDGWADSEETAQ